VTGPRGFGPRAPRWYWSFALPPGARSLNQATVRHRVGGFSKSLVTVSGRVIARSGLPGGANPGHCDGRLPRGRRRVAGIFGAGYGRIRRSAMERCGRWPATAPKTKGPPTFPPRARGFERLHERQGRLSRETKHGPRPMFPWRFFFSDPRPAPARGSIHFVPMDHPSTKYRC
jgi:hypothetical protein